MKNHSKTHNSMKGKRYAVALGIALVIGAFLGGYLSGKRSPNATNKVVKVEEVIPVQPEANEEAKAIGGGDAAAEFRERHNRALSPQAREDNRRKLWEENFPWKPTYDSANTVTAEMVSDEPKNRRATDNHFQLKQFFDNELRFSPQFEQICRIMEEYDRTENPVALGLAFDHLREYHRILWEENLDELVRRADGTPAKQRVRGDPITLSDGSPGWTLTDKWETYTHRENAESMKESIGAAIAAESLWPHKERMPYDKIVEVEERLISEISGWADVKGDDLIWGTSGDPKVRMALKVGDPLLTPYEGYQAGYDAYEDERNRAINEGMAEKRRQNRPAGILADGTLVNANNEPIQAGAGSFGSFLNFGEKFDLQEMNDGSIRLSPEAMAVLNEEVGKQEKPLKPSVLGNPAPTDEEWRLQEAQRILEEAARQQE